MRQTGQPFRYPAWPFRLCSSARDILRSADPIDILGPARLQSVSLNSLSSISSSRACSRSSSDCIESRPLSRRVSLSSAAVAAVDAGTDRASAVHDRPLCIAGTSGHTACWYRRCSSFLPSTLGRLDADSGGGSVVQLYDGGLKPAWSCACRLPSPRRLQSAASAVSAAPPEGASASEVGAQSSRSSVMLTRHATSLSRSVTVPSISVNASAMSSSAMNVRAAAARLRRYILLRHTGQTLNDTLR